MVLCAAWFDGQQMCDSVGKVIERLCTKFDGLFEESCLESIEYWSEEGMGGKHTLSEIPVADMMTPRNGLGTRMSVRDASYSESKPESCARREREVEGAG